MNSKTINGYVFSKDYRIIDRWAIPLSIAILFAFSFTLLIPVFEGTHDIDIVPHIVAAAFLLCVGMFLLGHKVRYSKLVWMYYSFDKDVVSNQCGKIKRHVFVNHSVFITELSISFATKGATWQEKYYILSNDPLPKIAGIEKGGVQLVKTLHEQKLVIIPANDNTKHCLSETAELDFVPQYPKVAYLQRFST